MAANPDKIEILRASSKKETPHRKIKESVYGIQSIDNGNQVNSGSMTGCHLVIGANSNQKFLSHNNEWKDETLRGTQNCIDTIGREGSYYLFLTTKSLREFKNYKNVEDYVIGMEKLYGVEFEQVYYVDDTNLNRVEVDFNFETGKMTVDGINEKVVADGIKVEFS